MEQIKSRIRNGSREFRDEMRERTLGYIIASFGLVAGLAWNEAIKAFIESYFPMQKQTLMAKFIYAVAITVFLVLISLYLAKFFRKKETAKDKKS